MKIIKQGDDPRTKPIHDRCVQCHTEVEYLPHEARYVTDQREGDFYEINCPVCKHVMRMQAPRGYWGPG